MTKTLDPLDIQIGSNLRQIRTTRSMSLQTLGDAIGMTYQQIQKYEKGHNRIAVSTLVRIAIVLDNPVIDFMAGIEGIGAPAQLDASHLNVCLQRIHQKAPVAGQRLAALAQAMADSDLIEVGREP